MTMPDSIGDERSKRRLTAIVISVVVAAALCLVMASMVIASVWPTVVHDSSVDRCAEDVDGIITAEPCVGATAQGDPVPRSTDPTAAMCDGIREAALGLGRVDGSGTTSVSARAREAAAALRSAADAAGGNDGRDLEVLAGFDVWFADVLVDLDAAREEADRTTATAVDQLLSASGPYVHALHTEDYLVSAIPGLASRCDFEPTTSEDVRSAMEFMHAIDGVLATELGSDDRFAWLADYSSEGLEVTATSTLVGEFDDCWNTINATRFGDDPGCDALHQACRQRDLLACNDLYRASVIGSDYEQFGATCGERVRFGDIGWGGYCEELE